MSSFHPDFLDILSLKEHKFAVRENSTMVGTRKVSEETKWEQMRKYEEKLTEWKSSARKASTNSQTNRIVAVT